MATRTLGWALALGAAVLLLAAACATDEAANGGDESTATATADGSTPVSNGDGSDVDATPDPNTPVTSTPDDGTGRPPATEEPSTPLPPPPGRVLELAQIVSVDMAVAESFPPQYFVGVVSAQPDGCHEFSHFEVERDGTTVEVLVYNSVPENLAVVSCIALYSETTSNVALGSDFESGETYTLIVNGQRQDFVAQ